MMTTLQVCHSTFMSAAMTPSHHTTQSLLFRCAPEAESPAWSSDAGLFQDTAGAQPLRWMTRSIFSLRHAVPYFLASAQAGHEGSEAAGGAAAEAADAGMPALEWLRSGAQSATQLAGAPPQRPLATEQRSLAARLARLLRWAHRHGCHAQSHLAHSRRVHSRRRLRLTQER